jgi:predicted CoA-substrate-specific enzyme activase
MKFFAGIDIGASTTKAVIINENREILGYCIADSGADFKLAADKTYGTACAAAGCALDDNTVVATGYGRRNVPFANVAKTEISCHAEGSYYHFPRAHTLIDIGGQDSKVIKIDDQGKRISFKMNRKCAAGTGAFLEEIAARLKISREDLNGLAERARENIQIGSYCTVFAATEILSRIREGVSVPEIIKGIFSSVIKRVLEMDSIEGEVAVSGGVVAHNPYLVKMFEEKIGKKISVPLHPQLTGAIGAALLAIKIKEV